MLELKEGSSIGLAMLSAFISLALNKPPRAGIAVTGEVDLNANVMFKAYFFILKYLFPDSSCRSGGFEVGGC